MFSKASLSTFGLRWNLLALLPTLFSILYFQRHNLTDVLDTPHLQTSITAPSSSSPASTTTTSTNDPFSLLRARYAHSCPSHAYTTRLFSLSPLIIYIQDLIPLHERRYLIHLASDKYHRSTLLDDQAPDSELVSDFRTSSTAFVFDDPVAECILARAAAFQGRVPLENMEILQVVKYGRSEKIGAHFDWGHSDANPRMSTVFAYVACDDGEEEEEEEGGREGSSDEDTQSESKSADGGKTAKRKATPTPKGECIGGATQFIDLSMASVDRSSWCDVIDCFDDSGIGGVPFKAIPGNAVYWSNLHSNGTYDEQTMHAGMPVRKGRKVALNIWTRGWNWRGERDEVEEERLEREHASRQRVFEEGELYRAMN